MAKRHKLGLGQGGQLCPEDMSTKVAKGWVEGRTVGQSKGAQMTTRTRWRGLGQLWRVTWGPHRCPRLHPSPGAVRSFGSAKARYDFCARDRTELTLREGDVIRVLSKKGHPGWWKGEIYGRVWSLPHLGTPLPGCPPLPQPRPKLLTTFSQHVFLLSQVGWFPANYVEEDYSEYC